MARADLRITRRTFLTSAGATAGIAGLAPAAITAAADDGDVPWYRRGRSPPPTTSATCARGGAGSWSAAWTARSQKIDGNPNDPKSRGMLCARGQGGVSFLEDPDRLQAPMVRTGTRGEGKVPERSRGVRRSTRSPANLGEVRDRYGDESVAIFGRTSGEFWFADYFAQAWGTPNAAKPSSGLCLSPAMRPRSMTLGFPVGGHEPVDWDALECVTLIGSHIGEDARNTVMQDFATAWGRGAAVIVVDPALLQRRHQGRPLACPSSRAPTPHYCSPG